MTTPSRASVSRAQEIVVQMVDDVPHAMLTGQQNAALVKLVATALDEQIEACAKVADEHGDISDLASRERFHEKYGFYDLANAIRSRKERKPK